MNVNNNNNALLFSASFVPFSSLIASTLGCSLRFSHQSLAAPPANIGNVIGVGRYIPNPKEVPIPVAHSIKPPRAKPSPKAIQSP